MFSRPVTQNVMVHSMKNFLLIVFDFSMCVAGLILIPIGFIDWRERNFELTTVGQHPEYWGTQSFIMILFGIGMFCYGVIDFIIFRNPKIKSINRLEKK